MFRHDLRTCLSHKGHLVNLLLLLTLTLVIVLLLLLFCGGSKELGTEMVLVGVEDSGRCLFIFWRSITLRAILTEVLGLWGSGPLDPRPLHLTVPV